MSTGIPIDRPLYATDAKGKPLVPLRPTVDRAIDLEDSMPFAERIQILQSRQPALTHQQIDLMAKFVGGPSSPSAAVAANGEKASNPESRIQNLTPEELHALKNDVLNLLARQADYREQLVKLLRAIHEDPTQDAVMRDYALQFLSGLAFDAGTTSDNTPQWKAVEGTDPWIASTALLHLLYESQELGFSSSDRTRLSDAAYRMAADSKIPAPNRATALQVCGQLGDHRALSVAYDLARSADESFPLRIAAVATLGDLGAGDAQIKSYLQQLVTGRELRLRIPASSALQRLDHRKS